jgi:pimeloyl-ACP methyl ester carboxylesterase
MDGLADAIPKVATASTATALQRAFIRTLLLAQTPEGYISNCRAIINASVPAYKKIKSPLLLVAGAEDFVCPIELSQKIHDRYVSLRLLFSCQMCANLSLTCYMLKLGVDG